MEKRDVVRLALEHKRPPYVPWQFGFTVEAKAKLRAHYGADDIDGIVGNHFLKLGREIGLFEDIGEDLVRDHFGVTWDRSIDKDIGNVKAPLLTAPTLKDYTFPDPKAMPFFADIPQLLAAHPDRFRVFYIGFSLWERAWSLRGMEQLMMDFHDHPRFVHDLLEAIADYNLAQIQEALRYDIDAVYFGDDWGQQRGLQMRPETWREFIARALKRMYGAVRAAGKYVIIHSCGDVDELFDDLVVLGLNCFNPFQPEVMDVVALSRQYWGRLTFYGGLSLQRTLPYGSVADVQDEVRQLLALGAEGDLILSPAHDVEGDVPLANMLAFIDMARQQPGFTAA